jgi:hypothetical protein
LLAASPLLAGIGGRYFEDCDEATMGTRRPPDFIGVARYALDPTGDARGAGINSLSKVRVIGLAQLFGQKATPCCGEPYQ